MKIPAMSYPYVTYVTLLVFNMFLMIPDISEMDARRAAGLVIFRCREGAAADQAEWLLMQTSYGQHHWYGPRRRLTSVNPNSCLQDSS